MRTVFVPPSKQQNCSTLERSADSSQVVKHVELCTTRTRIESKGIEQQRNGTTPNYGTGTKVSRALSSFALARTAQSRTYEGDNAASDAAAEGEQPKHVDAQRDRPRIRLDVRMRQRPQFVRVLLVVRSAVFVRSLLFGRQLLAGLESNRRQRLSCHGRVKPRGNRRDCSCVLLCCASVFCCVGRLNSLKIKLLLRMTIDNRRSQRVVGTVWSRGCQSKRVQIQLNQSDSQNFIPATVPQTTSTISRCT
mgnify:CR=1 FL=1